VSFPIAGGCNCGAVRFEVTASFESASYCHCTRCQRRTGTGAAVSARTRPGAFRITDGEDALRAWRPETGMHKYFCGECGSALFSAPGSDFEQVGVRFGALDADPEIRPTYRQYTNYAAGWEPIPDDDLPRYPERRPPDASS
jgi:hypothetical protein